MAKEYDLVDNLSKHLFWDVDNVVIDQQKHAEYIITCVLQYGFFNDWEKLQVYYGLEKIINTALYILRV